MPHKSLDQKQRLNHPSIVLMSQRSQVTVNCSICNKEVAGGSGGWRGHTNGRTHRERAARYATPTYGDLLKLEVHRPANPTSPMSKSPSNSTSLPFDEAEPAVSQDGPSDGSSQATPPGFSECVLCDCMVLHQDWQAHLDSYRHVAIAALQAQSFAPASPTPQPPAQPSLDPSHPNTMLCPQCRVIVRSLDLAAHLQSNAHQDQVAQDQPIVHTTVPVQQASRLSCPVSDNQPQEPGPAATRSQIQSSVELKAVVETLSSTASYTPTTRETASLNRPTSVWSKREDFSSFHGPHLAVNPWEKSWELHPIPMDIKEMFVSSSPDLSRELNQVRKHIPQDLSLVSYEQVWQTLLFVEEIRMQHDLGRLGMLGVMLTQHDRYYHLDTSNSTERLPPLLAGDTILIKAQDLPLDGPSSEARVHYVSKEEVALCFDENFQSQPGQLFDITFQLNRTPLQRMHEALLMPFHPSNYERLLFPTTEHFKDIVPSSSYNTQHQIVNKSILDSPQQFLAVNAIRTRPFYSPPLIIWGPAGTGKTTVAIESIRQVLLHSQKARVLVCAPSDSAADFIAQHLLDLGNDSVFRLNSSSRPVSSLPPDLLPFSSIEKYNKKHLVRGRFYLAYDEDGFDFFSYPAKKRLRSFRVVVSTCNQGGEPYGIGLPQGHFTHIFIDDAAQALEPDIMIPILTMVSAKTNVILFGDHKQLGPDVHSPIARDLGLGTSYLERLINSPAYRETSALPGVSTVKLSQSFRSHPALLKFSNDVFYDELPKGSFPIIFHAVKGNHLQDHKSASYSNRKEAMVVKQYVEKLRSEGFLSSELGIITPYKAQCQEIRQILGPVEGYKIGSVEEFQGQDRKAVIISPVISGPNLVAHLNDNQDLGLVGQPRLFNVAITRARALLIIVGDPSALRVDPLWRLFMNHIYFNGGWRGAAFEWKPSEPTCDLASTLNTYISIQKPGNSSISDS